MPVQAKAREGQAVEVVPTFSSVGTDDATLGMCGKIGSASLCRSDGPKKEAKNNKHFLSEKRSHKVNDFPLIIEGLHIVH